MGDILGKEADASIARSETRASERVKLHFRMTDFKYYHKQLTTNDLQKNVF